MGDGKSRQGLDASDSRTADPWLVRDVWTDSFNFAGWKPTHIDPAYVLLPDLDAQLPPAEPNDGATLKCLVGKQPSKYTECSVKYDVSEAIEF